MSTTNNNLFSNIGRISKQLRKGNKQKIYIITSAGQRKRENENSGLSEYQLSVLDFLNNNPSTIREISRGTGISSEKVKRIIKLLQSHGYIMEQEKGDEY